MIVARSALWYRWSVSSTTRLLVLGVIRIFQPVHGYEVRRELMSWRVEEWASIAPGSIYNALKTLDREGMIEVTGTEQVGSRPERTSYRLTSRGQQELSDLLRETLWNLAMPQDPLIAAISLMAFVRRDELIAALEARAQLIKGGIAHGEYAIAAIDDIETPGHVREMLRLINARVGAELEWSAAFIKRLRAGEYRTADEPPWQPPSRRPGPASLPPSPRTAAAKRARTRPKSTGKPPPRKAKRASTKRRP
jgi:DNA-binding PadR family transcriptional regulator